MTIKKIRKITIILSLIIHLLFILSYKDLSSFRLFSSSIPEPANDEQENQIVFELVETPDDAESEQRPDDTNLLSDKNAVARDNHASKENNAGLPYSMGDMNVKNLPNIKQNPTEDQQPIKDENSKENDNKNNENVQDEIKYANSYNNSKFSRQALLKGSKKSEQRLKRPEYDNEEFDAKKMGGLSFNTYAWDFAPYMLHMKKKVERNVFPPPAFTHMGLISGDTTVRFKVMPNGEVKDLKVLKYTGHKALMETSVHAIENSNSFNPLPANFPENYLEVTATFSYYIKK